MKCAVLNVLAISGTIMRKWKSATQILTGQPLVNTMTNRRRKKMNIKTLTMTRKEFKQYKTTHDPADYSYYHFLDHRNRRMYVVYETAP